MAANTPWRSLVNDVAHDDPELAATTRNVLTLLIEVDKEIDKRGSPYPQTLAYIVAVCEQVDPTLRDVLDEQAPETTANFSVEGLLQAYAGDGGQDWARLGAVSAAWLAQLAP
ncbi:MAG: hypothetical protein MUF33_03400 [Candidatus Nanopelagicales bacterium]|jgi:hypothetical protein|nr:hypothetical protein [Candidatus Nanopelagicales bacterium]